NKRLQTAYQQIDLELELARHIQESFLPRTLPELPQVRFAVKYRPCERVGGDFYDVFRLDEKHLGFYVADAMGHGVPASLPTRSIDPSMVRPLCGKSRAVSWGCLTPSSARAPIGSALATRSFFTPTVWTPRPSRISRWE